MSNLRSTRSLFKRDVFSLLLHHFELRALSSCIPSCFERFCYKDSIGSSSLIAKDGFEDHLEEHRDDFDESPAPRNSTDPKTNLDGRLYTG